MVICLDARIRKVVKKIRDETLRQKVSEFLNDLTVEVEGKTHVGMMLEKAPASRFRHHSYPSGLIEHILSAVSIALSLCDSVEKIYGGKVDRDLAIAGVLLHDILKPLTYDVKEDGSYISSPLGERLDHLTLIISKMIKRGLPLDLIHTVASSHGESGPITPKTVEALICHLADVADSQLNGEVLNAAKYLIKEAGESLEIKDSRTAFRIINSKATGGWSLLRCTVEKIKKKE
jgi:7,8-dihydroneopterin 2',3'-cyclic phosphate phosphodiesterase